MDRIEIEGGVPLAGAVRIAGAKNACLAQLPAAILTGRPVRLRNVPDLTDVDSMLLLLASLGVEAERSGDSVSVSAETLTGCRADYHIVRKMRASFLVLGPLLARLGRAEVSLPGGCAIGERGVNLHLEALAALGAEIDLRDGYVEARAPRGLTGALVSLPYVSVGATENAMMAAALATGETEIHNAAREPEIVALADLLAAMGATVEGAGDSTLRIQGADSLEGAEVEVIPDRIELGSFMAAAAVTGGALDIEGGRLDHAAATVDAMRAAGVHIEETGKGIRVSAGPLRPMHLATGPYPSFSTDLQAQMMALLALAEGESVIEERVFEHRFMHVPELARMGADIHVSGPRATIRGVERLRGAPVMATDLRASMCLVLAGLAAEGCTEVRRVYHLDRGYERLVDKLAACGARIRRVAE